MICAVGTVGAVSDDSLNNMSEISSNDGFISAGNEKIKLFHVIMILQFILKRNHRILVNIF